MYTNRELVYGALNHQNMRHILKFFMGDVLARTGRNVADGSCDPEVFAAATVEYAQKYGLSLHLIAGLMDTSTMMAGGLLNSEGKESLSGKDTIHTIEDINLLKMENPAQSNMLKGFIACAEAVKKVDPDTPIVGLFQNTPMVVSELIGEKSYYKALLRDKKLIFELSGLVEPIIEKGLECLAEAGCEIIWTPMPTMGGSCISKEMYTELCHPYSKRMVDYAHNLGMKVIIHTCGDWNDRFDVVVEEGPDAVHLSGAGLPSFRRKFGDKTCMMGNVSIVKTLLYKTPKQVYEESYQACIDAAGDGGFILGPDCSVPPMVDERNLFAMFKAGGDAEKVLFRD